MQDVYRCYQLLAPTFQTTIKKKTENMSYLDANK